MIRFHPGALAEIERARDWYDAQRVGLGGDLVATIERVLDANERTAAAVEAHRCVREEPRASLVARP